MKAKTIAIIVILTVLTASMVLWYQSWSGPLFHSTYEIGDEIRGFPVTEMSITFTDITVSKTASISNIPGLPSQSVYVIFDVAVKNLEDEPIYFDRASDFTDRFSKVVHNHNFFLTFGAENHLALPKTGYIDTTGFAAGMINTNWEMEINMMNARDVTSLQPHETVYGSLYFIKGEYYTSNELICRQGYETNPVFTVNLKK